MLSLDSPRWSQLAHAYGPATDMPKLLVQLASSPAGPDAPRIWNALFGALVHQGSVWQAAFAVVPHLAEIAQKVQPRDRSVFVEFMGSVAMHVAEPLTDPDWGECVGAFRRINSGLDEVIQSSSDDPTRLRLAACRAAFEGCPKVAKRLSDRADGMTFEVECPEEDCGVTVALDFIDGARAHVYESGEDPPDEPTELPASARAPLQPGSRWTSEDAVARVAMLLERLGGTKAAAMANSLEVQVGCPTCGSTFALLRALLEQPPGNRDASSLFDVSRSHTP